VWPQGGLQPLLGHVRLEACELPLKPPEASFGFAVLLLLVARALLARANELIEWRQSL